MHTKSDSMQNLWRIHQGMDVDLASVLEYLRQMEAGVWIWVELKQISRNLVRQYRQFMIPTIFSTVAMQNIFPSQSVIANIMSASSR